MGSDGREGCARLPANRCRRCGQQPSGCVCAHIHTVAIDFDFLVIRHWKECSRGSNSARLAPLAMPRCELRDWGERGTVFDDSGLAAQGTWLLFPDAQTSDGSELVGPRAHVGIPEPLPQRIVVVDGSWKQVRKMVRRIGALSQLPRFVVSPSPRPMHRLRAPPFPGGMATLEAMARVVELAHDAERAEPLYVLYEQLVRSQRRQQGVGPDGEPLYDKNRATRRKLAWELEEAKYRRLRAEQGEPG